MVDDGVDRDGCLAGLAVADDEFALAASEGNHRIDDQNPGREGPRHERPVDDGRGRSLDWGQRLRRERRSPIERRAKRVDHAAKERFPNGNAGNLAGAMHDAPGRDFPRVAKQHASDTVLAKVDGEAMEAAFEYEQLIKPCAGQARNHRDAVADLDDMANMFDLRREGERADTGPACIYPAVQIVSERCHERRSPSTGPRARFATRSAKWSSGNAAPRRR